MHVSILTHGDGNSLVWVEAELDEEAASRHECSTVSWHIEFDRDRFQSGSFALDDIAFDITDCLAIETGLLLGEQVCLLVQTHQPFISSLFEKGVCERERFLTESLYHFGFVSSRICLEKYCTLHDSNRQDLPVSCLRNCRQFLPPINGVGFLGAFR